MYDTSGHVIKRTGRGKGNPFRPSQTRPEPKHHASMTALILETAPRWACAEVEETVAGYLIPRQSLSRRQRLADNIRFETEPRIFWQAEKDAKGKLTGRYIPGTDQRQVWRSDDTLLIKGKPQSERGRFTRVTSITKVRRYEPEEFNTQDDFDPFTDEAGSGQRELIEMGIIEDPANPTPKPDTATSFDLDLDNVSFALDTDPNNE